MKISYKIVNEFEKTIAKFSGSKYAVALDSCSNSIFLCLKYLNLFGGYEKQTITIPKKTYISIPCAIRNAGFNVEFEDLDWTGAYQLKPLPLFDGALRFKRGMYNGGFHCLSFHIKKHLNIGRGGMILTNDKDAYDWFKLARFNGREAKNTAHLDSYKVIGWNFYMTNYDAARGLWLFSCMDKDLDDIKSKYSDLSEYDFNKYEPGEYIFKK
jgi:dTDP-4-amino-4,6-dideoxygalactose transaminase